MVSGEIEFLFEFFMLEHILRNIYSVLNEILIIGLNGV